MSHGLKEALLHLMQVNIQKQTVLIIKENIFTSIITKVVSIKKPLEEAAIRNSLIIDQSGYLLEKASL